MKELVFAKADYTTPFELEDESNKQTNRIGGKVMIKGIKKEGMDPEDYYYLKKFENKTGTIFEQNKSKSGKFTYKVMFDQNHYGYFYQEDFITIDEDKPR